MSRSHEWRRGHDNVIRHLDTFKGCRACLAAEWLNSILDGDSDHALGMRDAYRAAIQEGHTCRERGGEAK
jgi:hypothetical protein